MTKNELRREMRMRLRASANQAADKSRAIVAAIRAHPAWAHARVVSLYSALAGEPDLAALRRPESEDPGDRSAETGERRPDTGERKAEGEAAIRFCYPRIEAGGMTFFEVGSSDELISASWHPRILEPIFDPACLVPPQEIDLILVPGLAFTRDGQRLGRGGGFYDRYLASLPARAMKLGVCFQCQVLESLPSEAHDQRVHAIATETGIAGHLPAHTATE